MTALSEAHGSDAATPWFEIVGPYYTATALTRLLGWTEEEVADAADTLHVLAVTTTDEVTLYPQFQIWRGQVVEASRRSATSATSIPRASIGTRSSQRRPAPVSTVCTSTSYVTPSPRSPWSPAHSTCTSCREPWGTRALPSQTRSMHTSSHATSAPTARRSRLTSRLPALRSLPCARSAVSASDSPSSILRTQQSSRATTPRAQLRDRQNTRRSSC